MNGWHEHATLPESLNHLQKDSTDRVLNTLIEKAGMPPRLLEVSDIMHWDGRYLKGSPEGEFLFTFAKWVYPVVNESNSSDVYDDHRTPRDEFRKFMDARSKLSGFWDLWVKRTSVRAVETEFPKEKQLVLALCWLDISHRQRVGEFWAAKEYLYKLGCAYEKKAPNIKHR